eukprot:UN03911
MSLTTLDSVRYFDKNICDLIVSYLSHATRLMTTSNNPPLTKLNGGSMFLFNFKTRIGYVVRSPPYHHQSWVLTKFQLHLSDNDRDSKAKFKIFGYLYKTQP